MFMPYIEGLKMNWTVDDGLYHRFLKWQLKRKTILDCKLANLPTKPEMPKDHSMVWLILVWTCMYHGTYQKMISR